MGRLAKRTSRQKDLSKSGRSLLPAGMPKPATPKKKKEAKEPKKEAAAAIEPEVDDEEALAAKLMQEVRACA